MLGGAEDGGLEKHTIELSHALKEKGIDICVIAHKKFKDDFKGIKFIELDLNKGRNNPFVLYKLYKILKKDNFDIIHTQANKATQMVIKLKPFLKSKVISTLHSYKKNIKSFEKADFVITVSERIGEKLKTKNRDTVYNGVEIDGIKKINLYKKFGIAENRFIVCGVGRLVDVKKFDILIQSIKNTSVHLLIIGDGEKKEELLSLIKKLNIEDRVTCTGTLNQKDTREIIKSSNLVCITSKKEGFSYVFAESLMLHTPLISTDVADIKKFLTKKFIIPFENIDIISDKIRAVELNYNETLKEFKEKFLTSQENFSIKNMIDKTIKIYERVLKHEV